MKNVNIIRKILVTTLSALVFLAVVMLTIMLTVQINKSPSNTGTDTIDGESGIMSSTISNYETPSTSKQLEEAKELQERMDKIMSDLDSPESLLSSVISN